MAPNDKKKMDDMTTTESKDFGNPVQVDADKTYISRTAANTSDTTRDRMEKDRQLREKTAHIGWKASQESQGNSDVSADDSPMMNNK